MKIRTSFVSNSSSSSFIILAPVDGIPCVKLNKEQKDNIMEHVLKDNEYMHYDPEMLEKFKEAIDVYLTAFLDDCSRAYDNIPKERLYYCDGEHGGTPYCPEYFHNLQPGSEDWEGVYIRKEDDNYKKYKSKDLVKVLTKGHYLVKEYNTGVVELIPQEDGGDETGN